MAEQSGGQNRCNECGQTFNSSSELREHQRTNHKGSRPGSGSRQQK